MLKHLSKFRIRESSQIAIRLQAWGIAQLSGHFCTVLFAQRAVHDAEPNNTPAEANKIDGAVTIMGTMAGEDQDGFIWSVPGVSLWSFARNAW